MASAVIGAASLWLCAGLSGARADQSLPTQALGSDASPIRIDACRAALLDHQGANSWIPAIAKANQNYYVAAAVDFTNVSTKPVEAVRFVFDVRDTFDEVTQTLGLDWEGTFTPGVQIHARSNLAGAVGVAGQKNTGGAVKNVVCRVNDVRFADGDLWRYGQGPKAGSSGLSYPTYPPSPPPPSVSR